MLVAAMKPAFIASSIPRARTVLQRLFAPACAVCALGQGPICSKCEDDFFPATRIRCMVCALPVATTDTICGRCQSSPPHFQRTTALADYAPPVDGMMLALKFRARLDLATLFGRLLARRTSADRAALVVPVPLAFERQSERGFNQSLQIARTYARVTGAQLAADCIQRIRHAPSQQTLALADRRRNVRGAFEATKPLTGARILVIDDVLTSGSTLDEMARILIKAGAADVHALVVARTP